MNFFNLFKKKVKTNSNFIDSIDLEFAKKEIEDIKPFQEWFMKSVNSEGEKIVRSWSMPSKLYLKYPIISSSGSVKWIYSHYGDLEVVVDENMEQLMKIE